MLPLFFGKKINLNILKMDNSFFVGLEAADLSEVLAYDLHLQENKLISILS